MMKAPRHLHLVSRQPDPRNILTHLLMALCESYNLDLDETSDRLRGLIEDLCEEVAAKHMDHEEFQVLMDFIASVMNSDAATIEEFLRYAEAAEQ